MTAPISLGTTKLGRNTDVKYPAAFDLPDDNTVSELLHVAHDLGVRLIDSAPAYGMSEKRLGDLLPGRRDDWILCTKAGEFYENGQSYFDFSAEAITRSVHQSLRHLKTDYVDVLLIHSDGNDLSIVNETDAIDCLIKLKEQNMVHQIGMSTKTSEGGMAALGPLDLLMVTLSPNDLSQLAVIEEARKRGKGILLKKIFDSGHSLQQRSLELALTTPGVSSAVVGTANPDHLRQNVSQALDIIDP